VEGPCLQRMIWVLSSGIVLLDFVGHSLLVGENQRRLHGFPGLSLGLGDRRNEIAGAPPRNGLLFQWLTITVQRVITRRG
jgi:hypothetical protein